MPLRRDPATGRPRPVHADVPSETALLGLPDVGEGASAAHLARDSFAPQVAEDEAEGAPTPPLPGSDPEAPPPNAAARRGG